MYSGKWEEKIFPAPLQVELPFQKKSVPNIRCVKCGEILEACELAIHQELDCRAAYEAEEPPHKNNVASKWSLLFVNIISVELGM